MQRGYPHGFAATLLAVAGTLALLMSDDRQPRDCPVYATVAVLMLITYLPWLTRIRPQLIL